MKIENNSLYYKQNSNKTIGRTDNSFENYLGKLKDADKNSNKDRFIKRDSEFNSIGLYSKVETKISQLQFPIETEHYTIELANELEGVQAYVIKDKELGGGLYLREDELVIQQDAETGMEFIINMDQPLSMNLLVTSELKSVLSDMAEKRGFDLRTDSLQGGLTICQDVKTGLSYMTIKGNEAKGVSVVVTSQQDVETIDKLAQEFMKYSISSESSTAGLYALLEISGNLRRGEDGLTFLTPNGVTYIPYDGDSKKAWEIEMSGAYYAIARESLATGNDFENSKAWLQKLRGANIAEGFVEVWDYYKFDGASQSCRYR